MSDRYAILDEWWVSDGGQGEPEWEEVKSYPEEDPARHALAHLKATRPPRGRYKLIDRGNYCQEMEEKKP